MGRINILFGALAVILIMISCERDNDKTVKYLVTNSVSGFDLNYVNEQGTLVSVQVPASSAGDKWAYSFIGEEGDIVFASGIYKDINSAIKIQVLIDGKVFKEGSSSHDTTRYVTVSGTIPYD